MENLHQLVDRLITSFLPAAVHNHNFFINEVPGELSVEHNKEWVASIISGMIATAVGNTRDNRIRFSAKKYGYVFVLELHEAGRANNYAVNTDLQQIQGLAEKIGGCLFINSHNEEKIVMSFSFPNLPVAA
jgi:hypothetical protein